MNSFLHSLKTQGMRIADIRDVTDLGTSLGQEMLTIYERSFSETKRDPIDQIARWRAIASNGLASRFHKRPSF